MPTNAPVSPPTPATITLSTAIENTVRTGLAEQFKSIEWTSALVDWLHERTGISKWRLKLAVWLFSVIVSKAAAWAGSGAGRITARVFAWVFARIPGSVRITKALTTLDRAKAAEVELAAVQTGRLAPRDAKLTEHLSPSSRAQFVTQVWLHRIVDRLEPQPFLDFSYLSPETEARQFLYTSRSARLLGRDREMAALRAFLDVDTPFAWWVVQGPGGVGKSRLALEFALRSSGPWRMGFLRSPRNFGWCEWRPIVPTAMIADYANEMAEELGDIVRDLAARAKQGECTQPVRLLLLVRDAEGPWKSQFFGTGARRAAIESVRYGDPLAVSPLDDDAIWEVLRSVVPAGIPLPDRQATLANLLYIDPERRPLFSLFAGDAIRHGRDIRKWDADALVDDVLEREKEHWRKAGVTERDKNLLALATMTAGLETRRITGLDPLLFPRVWGDGSPDSFDPLRYQAMVGTSAERVLAPLLPDILGEMFVLEHLQPRYAGDFRRADALRTTSWDLGSDGMFSFLTRAAMDFPHNETLRLLDPPPPLTDDRANRSTWALAAANLILLYGNAGRLDDSRRVYRDMWALPEAQTSEGLVRPRAIAAFNLLTIYRKAEHGSEVRDLYKELRALSDTHAGDRYVRELRAQAAVTLLSSLKRVGTIDEGRELYEEVRTLSHAHGDDETLWQWQALAAVNLLSLLADVGGVEQVINARNVYEELRVWWEARTGDGKVRFSHAWATFNLLVAYVRSGQMDAARDLYEVLCALSEAHAGDGVLLERRAEAAAYILTAYGRAGQVVEAQKLYEELRALSKSHVTGDWGACKRQAGAAFDLLVAYEKAEQVDAARQLYEELCVLSEACAGDKEVRKWRARAAYNLLLGYEKAEQVDEARQLYEELCVLSEACAGDEEVRKWRASTASNLLIAYGKAGHVDEARQMYEELCVLSEACAGDAEIRKWRATAAFNLLVAYEDAEQIDGAQQLYRELRELSEVHADDRVMWEWRAMAAVNLVRSYASAGRVDEAQGLYTELRGLSEVRTEDRGLQVMRAMGAFNLLNTYVSEGRADEARALQNDLRDLSVLHPDVPAITSAFTVGSARVQRQFGTKHPSG
jgi:pentatricopeptide repeat protein